MAEVTARITAVDGEHATVSINETGCGRCHEPGGCGGNNLGQMFCTSPRNYRVLNPRHARVGETVTVVIAENAVIRSAVSAYAVPLIALFAGAILGWILAEDTGSIIGACCGLGIAWIFLRVSARKALGTGPKFLPYIK